jgi:hypothetical protein
MPSHRVRSLCRRRVSARTPSGGCGFGARLGYKGGGVRGIWMKDLAQVVAGHGSGVADLLEFAEHWRSFHTLGEAERYRREQQVALDRKEWTDPAGARTPFSVVMADWSAGRLDVRPSTRAQNDAYIRSLIAPTFERRTLERSPRLASAHGSVNLDDQGYAASTMRKAYQLLASILEFAVAGGLIPKSPASEVALPRIERVERRFLSVEEIERLASAVIRYGTFIRTLAYCGPRSGEARASRVGDLDLFRRRMSITRTMVEVNGGRVSFAEPKDLGLGPHDRDSGVARRSPGRPVRGPRS